MWDIAGTLLLSLTILGLCLAYAAVILRRRRSGGHTQGGQRVRRIDGRPITPHDDRVIRMRRHGPSPVIRVLAPPASMALPR